MIVYFAIISISSQPLIIWIWYFWQLIGGFSLIFFVFFPVILFFGIIIYIISAIITSKIFLVIVNIIHKPREGVFLRDKSDKDYCYWSLRAVIRKWPTWLARQIYLPFLEILALKILGTKTSGTSALHEGWVDCEFIKLGKNVRLGQGSLIMSNLIVQDKLIIKRVEIGDNVVIGAHSVICPGTKIGDNTIIDAISMTSVNQYLEANSIYSGIPVKKVGENKPLSENEIEFIKSEIFVEDDEEKLRKTKLEGDVKELGIPFHIYLASGWWIIGGSYIIPAIIFIFFTFGIIEPILLSQKFTLTYLLQPNILILMFLTPIIYVGIYLLHLFFVALFTRWFYRIADLRGPAEGVFDRNLDETSKALDYYHWRSFLLKYPVFAIIRSPFPWLVTWELRFIRSNKIGKGTVFEECYVHSHIYFGKNCYYGTFAHITNHLVDGVYGEENLTFYGARIGDNCIFNALIGGLPGLEVEGDATFLPLTSTVKYDKLGKGGVYGGFPARRLNNEQIKRFTGGEIDNEQE
ncbi:MAG: acyltransferase [Promethearchaeota archaeon]